MSDLIQQNLILNQQASRSMGDPSSMNSRPIMKGGVFQVLGISDANGFAPKLNAWSDAKFHMFGQPRPPGVVGGIIQEIVNTLKQGGPNLMEGVGTADIYGHGNMQQMGGTNFGDGITFEGSTTQIGKPMNTPDAGGGASVDTAYLS